MATTLAIVEDDADIRDNYSQFLQRQGYQVLALADRKQAMAHFTERLPELVIIDVGLAGEIEGGFDLCRWLRARSETLPIVFLTARDSEIDTISGLRLGADDYLSKDISLAQLSTRIATLLRRVAALSAPAQQDELVQRGDLSLDPEAMLARWKGSSVDLTVTEFAIVNCLARRPGHIKSRDQLMQAADVLVDDSTINSHIKRIRRKFELVDTHFAAIEAVYGAGYRWHGAQHTP